MEATVAERGQITLPKAVRDALGLTKGTQLKVELDGGRIILRKNVDDALSRLRGKYKLPEGVSSDDVMRELRGRAPGDPYPAPLDEPARPQAQPPQMIAVDSAIVVDLLGSDARADAAEEALRRALALGPVVVCDVAVAEVVAGLGFGSDFVETLEDAGHPLLVDRAALGGARRRDAAPLKQRARAEGHAPRRSAPWPTS